MNFKFQIIQDMHKRRGDDHAKNILITLGITLAVPFVTKIPDLFTRLIFLFMLFFGMYMVLLDSIRYISRTSLLNKAKKNSQIYDFYLVNTEVLHPDHSESSIVLTFESNSGLFNDTITHDPYVFTKYFESLDKEEFEPITFNAYLMNDTFIMSESEIVSKIHQRRSQANPAYKWVK